ncbi:RmlC-like cupins superfamily protein [Perilla frutescens var. frutescens]|nr:RmlC-like cupins superfamily protein [Perilla frutescens var. frutescens]
MMGKRRVVLAVALVALVVAVSGYEDEERWSRGRRHGGDEGGTGRREGDDWFLLQESKHVVTTDAGSMKVVKGFGGKFMQSPMHIGFITMEPKSMFIPQYLDSSLILFVRRGEARVGNIYKDELVERKLKTGDIYRIGAGSAFYLINTAEGQRLHIICSIATSQNLGHHALFQSFYIAGGTYPTSVLAGFDHLTLSTALNVTEEEVREMLTRQDNGPIVYLSNTTEHSPTFWSKFLDMEHDHKTAQMKRIVRIRAADDSDSDSDSQQQQSTWSFRKMLVSFMEWTDKKKGSGEGATTGKGPDAYNLYGRDPDFKNDYGWSMALDEKDYSPLSHDDIGVYLVNLTAGSMMAPHINPMAMEYGIVLRGAGTIQVVYPNGSLAMNAKVSEGEVFWIPRFFPFCQIASRTGPFEFFGFTTSARKNWPQFLVGANSLLQTMRGPAFAASFGLTQERMDAIIDSQRESTILPSATVAPPDEAQPVKADI